MKFKGKRGPYTIIENGVEKEIITGYDTMRSLKIEELKDKQKKRLQTLKNEIKIDKEKVDEYEKNLKKLQEPLIQVQGKIKSILEPHRGTKNIETLSKLKENIDKMKKELSTPMYYANKTTRVLNINLLLVSLFGVNIDLSSNDIKLVNLNEDVPICERLEKNITLGGITSNSSIRNNILDNKMNSSYLQVNINSPTLSSKNILLGPSDGSGTNTLFDCDKCYSLINNSTKKQLCEKSKYYETANLNALDLNAQYFFVSKILKSFNDGTLELDKNSEKKLKKFYKKLEYRCLECLGENYENKRAETDYIKNGFFSFEEATDNYKWLVNFIYDNKIPIDDDFIFHGIKYLNENSDIFTDELKNSFFEPTPPDVTDAISCPYPVKHLDTLDVDLTTLNEYILKSQNCNSNYIESQKDSYI